MTEPVDEYEGVQIYRDRLIESEERMASLAMQIEFSRAAAELGQMPGWQKLLQTITAAEAREMEQLRSGEMSLYRLGRRQGLLHGLRFLTSAKPLSAEDLASIDTEVTLLRKTITECRDMLT